MQMTDGSGGVHVGNRSHILSQKAEWAAGVRFSPFVTVFLQELPTGWTRTTAHAHLPFTVILGTKSPVTMTFKPHPNYSTT
jgi:hypothetical protein